MTNKRTDGFLPSEAVLERQEDSARVYRMEFPDGWGTMTVRAVMAGVTLVLNEFHTFGGFPEEARCPGLVEINHCQSGRFECTMRDGRVLWLGPRDFAVSDMSRPPVNSRFSQGFYRGISLILTPRTTQHSVNTMLGECTLDLEKLFSGLFGFRSFLLLRAEPKIQHIFSELYHVPPDNQLAYYRLKTAELMLFLQQQKMGYRAGACYYGQGARARVLEIGERMTTDLRIRIPIADLAKEYKLGESTVKKYFLQLYGEPPYAYLKRRRMEEAAFLLTTTKQTVTQIAAAVGYQNTSKFSAAFRDIYSLNPSEYKKMILSE